MKKVMKPLGNSYPKFFQRYLDAVPEGGNLIAHLKKLNIETKTLVESLDETKLHYRYAEGKWTIKEILLHIIDAERIFAYRALRIARHDQTPLPGFEENDYVPVSGANDRTAADLLQEMTAVHKATIALIKGLPDSAAHQTGTCSNHTMSVSGLLNLIAGHQQHHLNVIRERYL
ncbi:MAG: hypothetical protein RL757_1701 [Bacteroidota bacterium]|jgi:uncharacterized damage-inducible protein DinB